MAKQFDDDQVAVLQQIIHEYERGLAPETGESFVPRQKPLTYSELARVRRMIVAHTAAEAGKQVVEQAVKYAMLPPRSKTSTLLNDAADLINDAVRAVSTLTLSSYQPLLMGKEWAKLCDQLRDRATTFQKLDQ